MKNKYPDIKVGAKCKWLDPDTEHRDLRRRYIIEDIALDENGMISEDSVILLSPVGGGGETEVLPREIVVVTPKGRGRKKPEEKIPEATQVQPEEQYVIYDRGIKFLTCRTGPIIASGKENAEKVLTYMSRHFRGENDGRGHTYNFEIIPVPEGISAERFAKTLIKWAFDFDEWGSYGSDYITFFDPEMEKLNSDGSIRSLRHIKSEEDLSFPRFKSLFN